MIVGLLAMLGLFFATMPMSRRLHHRLAVRRGRVDFERFERAMARAFVSPTTIRFLWRELEAYYHAPLRPLPDDRLESMIAMDRPHIEGLVLHFWSSMRGQDPFPRVSPLGPDPSVAELGRHLDLLAGWTLRGAA